MEIDDLRRAPEPDDFECEVCGEPAVAAIEYYNLTPEYEERYGFCADHMPESQEELDVVTEAIKTCRDPFEIHDPTNANDVRHEEILEKLMKTRIYADAADDFDRDAEPENGQTLDDLF